MRNLLVLVSIVLCAAMIPFTSSAAVFNEIGDAGESLATAQIVSGGTTSIVGSTVGGADLYLFGWSGGNFQVDTNGSTGDPQLFLFDSLGVGIQGNDDYGPGFLAQLIVGSLAPGSYYLGISGWDYDPRDASNTLIFPSSPFATLFPPSSLNPLDHWGGTSGSLAYVINFNQETAAVVPEPSTLFLLGSGLVGLVGFGRKRRKN